MSSKLEKVTVRLRAGDTAYLSRVFPTRGYNKALQAIVSSFVDRHREVANRTLPLDDTPLDLVDLELADD